MRGYHRAGSSSSSAPQGGVLGGTLEEYRGVVRTLRRRQFDFLYST